MFDYVSQSRCIVAATIKRRHCRAFVNAAIPRTCRMHRIYKCQRKYCSAKLLKLTLAAAAPDEQLLNLEKCHKQCIKLKSHNSKILELIKSLEAVKRETHKKCQENILLLTENNRLECGLSEMKECCGNERNARRNVSEIWQQECKRANEKINKLELYMKEIGVGPFWKSQWTQENNIGYGTFV